MPPRCSPFVCAIAGALLVAAGARGAAAQSKGLDKETAQDVIRAGAIGVAAFDAVTIEINEARAVAFRMSSDAAFSQKMLELARRNDLAGITALIKPLTPRSVFQVTHVEDFTITIKGRRLTLCWSNTNGCGGGSWSIVVALS